MTAQRQNPVLGGDTGVDTLQNKLPTNNTTIKPLSEYRLKQYQRTAMGAAMFGTGVVE